MGNNSDYIKEVENYFLSLAGKGIMLSSMDYSLISNWKNKKIPKEVIYKGIKKAFENSRQKQGGGSYSIRSIKQCVWFVESSIDEYSPVIGNIQNKQISSDTEGTVDFIVSKLNQYISNEKEQNKKAYYLNLKEKLLTINDDNQFGYVSEIEQDCLEQFFTNIDETEKAQITVKAREMLGKRARQMTETAIEESLISFRNEILINKYNLKTISFITEE